MVVGFLFSRADFARVKWFDFGDCFGCGVRSWILFFDNSVFAVWIMGNVERKSCANGYWNGPVDILRMTCKRYDETCKNFQYHFSCKTFSESAEIRSLSKLKFQKSMDIRYRLASFE